MLSRQHQEQGSAQPAGAIWDLCIEHRRLFSEGFIALIEFDPQLSKRSKYGLLWDSDLAYKTGRFAHIKRQAFNEIFSTLIEEDQACVLAEVGMIDRLKAKLPSAFDDC